MTNLRGVRGRFTIAVWATVAVAAAGALYVEQGVPLAPSFARAPQSPAVARPSVQHEVFRATPAAVEPIVLEPLVVERPAAERSAVEPSLTEPSAPQSFGDEAGLDRLWLECEDGSGAACDVLFEQAPVDSDYERFGLSCGDRPEVLDCTTELDEPEPLNSYGQSVRPPIASSDGS